MDGPRDFVNGMVIQISLWTESRRYSHSKEMRGTYVCRAIEAYCMDVTARITSNDSVAETGMPEQRHYRCFELKATKLPTRSVAPEDDDKTIISPTRKHGAIV